MYFDAELKRCQVEDNGLSITVDFGAHRRMVGNSVL